MGEYGGVVAVVVVMIASFTAALGSIPVTDGTAIVHVAAFARSQHVSGTDARAAYEKAPYRKPSLRYLYSVAWVAAAKDRSKCEARLMFGPDPRVVAASAIKHSQKLLARLRAARLTVSQAASAIGRGTTDGCA
jgi:hypothetical protein